MTETEKQFVQILRSAVKNTSLPETADWDAVWKLACRNHLEAMVFEKLKNNRSVHPEIQEQMHAAYNQMVAREIVLDHTLKQIEDNLTAAGIHYAILKGGILKTDYPVRFTRYMSDIDLYIKPEDRHSIRKVIEKAGGVLNGSDSGDEQFLFWNQIEVEFHGGLCYKKAKGGIENYPEWEFVDESRNRLSEEGYALNLLGHAVHDLAGSGPGIRYILDLWVYRHLHQPQPDWEFVNDRLKKDGVYAVAQNLLDLSEYLFGDGEESPLMTELADYILEGGLYGSYRRGLISQAAGGNAMLKQIFRSRTEFENRYPWLKNVPFLLPAAWVMRLFQSFRGNRITIKRWFSGMNTISTDETEAQKEALSRFGL